jgi:hypothetical protein
LRGVHNRRTQPGNQQVFEAALAGEKSKLQGETLWYRLVVGGNTPRYVRLRPRSSLALILDERADQALPDKVIGLISTIKTEALNLRSDFLVNVTPVVAHWVMNNVTIIVILDDLDSAFRLELWVMPSGFLVIENRAMTEGATTFVTFWRRAILPVFPRTGFPIQMRYSS